MEISAQLQPRSVFLAGEQMFCSVRFHLPSSVARRTVCVAWSSVQLQCECVMDEKARMATVTPSSSSASLSSVANASGRSQTSLRPNDWLEGGGAQILSSSPKLLFCELVLRPGEVKTFSYCDRLPLDIPPSYRGKSIKFNYNLLIGTQILNASVQVLKVPFRVLTAPMFAGHDLKSPTTIVPSDEEDLAIANPFLMDSSQTNGATNEFSGDEDRLLRLQLQHVQQNEPGLFDIAVPSGHIAKLSLAKKSFKMGEEIIACLKFPRVTDNAIECVQYSVSLVCEEDIYSKGPNENDEERTLVKKSRVKIAKAQDFTLGFEESSLRLEVPLHSTPSFSSALCALSWHLHFEFVVVPKNSRKDTEMCNEDGCEWNAPQKLHVQTLEWNLPITIYPADPVHVEWLRKTTSSSHTISIKTERLDI